MSELGACGMWSRVLSAALCALAFLAARSDVAAAEGGRDIASAAPIQAGTEYSGDLAKAYHSADECPIARSWYTLTVAKGDEVSIAATVPKTGSLAVFQPGTTNEALYDDQRSLRWYERFPAPAPNGRGIIMVFSAESSGSMPIEVLADDCEEGGSATTYRFRVGLRPAPAPAADRFRAAWRKADLAYAESNLRDARRLITPLLPQRTQLSQVERLWFDVSAERIQVATGDRQAGRASRRDAGSVSPPALVRYDGNSHAPPSPSEGGCSPCPAAPKAPARPFCRPGTSSDLLESFADEAYPFIQKRPSRAAETGLLPSFFGANPCHTLVMTLDGSPGFFLQQVPFGRQRYSLAISADEPVVRRLRVRRGSRIEGQAYGFAPGQSAAVAWAPEQGGRSIRYTPAVRGERLRIPVPRAPGRYTLLLKARPGSAVITGLARVKVT